MAWAPSSGMKALLANPNYAPAKYQTTSHIGAGNYNTLTKRDKVGTQGSPTSHGTRSSNKTGGRTDIGPDIGKHRQSRKTEPDRAKEQAVEKVAIVEVAILKTEEAALKKSIAKLEQDMAELKESQAKGKRKRGNDTANKTIRRSPMTCFD